jgi:hypothetical protein
MGARRQAKAAARVFKIVQRRLDRLNSSHEQVGK